MSYNTANTVNDVWCWADHESPLSEPVSPKKEELHNMMLLTDGSQTIGVFKTTNGEHTSYDVTIKSEDHQQQQQQYNESYPSYSPYISSSESFSFSPFLTGSPIPSPTFSSTSHPSTMTTSFSFLPRTIGQTFSPASSPPLLPLSDDISVQLEDSPSIAPLSSPTFAKPSPALAPRFTPTLTSTPSSNSHHLQQPSHVSIAFSPHQLTRLSNPSLSLETFSLPPPSPTASLRHASQPFRVKQQQQQNNQQQHQNNQQQQLINQNQQQQQLINQNNQNQQQNNNNNSNNNNNNNNDENSDDSDSEMGRGNIIFNSSPSPPQTPPVNTKQPKPKASAPVRVVSKSSTKNQSNVAKRYCHVCRSPKEITKIVTCCSGKQSHVFCASCVQRRLGLCFETLMASNDWLCPKCENRCPCSKCRKRKDP